MRRSIRAILLVIGAGLFGSVWTMRLPAADPEGLYGIARPSPEAVLTSQLGGLLSEIYIGEGQSVQPGQVLAVTDNRISLAERKLAELATLDRSRIEHAEQEVKLTESLLNRLLQAEEESAVSGFELDEARVRFAQAASSLRAARHAAQEAAVRLEREEARLELHNIRAPFEGQVLHVHVTQGETLTDKQPVITLANLQQLEAELHLPLSLYGRLEVGEQYELVGGEPVRRPVKARLKYQSPAIDAAIGSFRCVFVIDNTDLKLPAGFPVRFPPAPRSLP